MITYKISKDGWSTYQAFNELLEVEQWVSVNLGDGYTIEVSTDYQVVPLTTEQKLKEDLDFGKSLIETFLIDNRNITPPVSPYESLELLTKFQNVEKLASLGDIKSVKVLLHNISVDERLFTQERKDKYLSMINSHLQN